MQRRTVLKLGGMAAIGLGVSGCASRLSPAVTGRPVLLLVMALLHGCTFFLSVVGRYLSRARTRRRPSLDVLAAQALEEIRQEAKSEKNEADESSL